MYDSANYPQPSAALIDAFVQAQPYAVVIGTEPSGYPSVSLLPFVRVGDRITVHMVQEDPTFRAFRANSKATVLVEEFLAFTPHFLAGPEDASMATLHFRAVQFQAEATVDTDARRVALVLEELLARYEPDEPHRPITDLEFYRDSLVRLGIADLRIVAVQPKFKTGQNRSPEARHGLGAYLREHGGWRGERAAQLVAGEVDS